MQSERDETIERRGGCESRGARCSRRGDSWLFPACVQTNQTRLQVGRDPGGSWGDNETVLISSVQTDQPEDDGRRRTGRKGCRVRIVQPTFKQAGGEASEQPAVMEKACSKESEEHSNILYYLQLDDRSVFPRQQEKAVQACGCFTALLQIIFILTQPSLVN